MIKGKRGKAQNDHGQKINYDSIIVHHKIKKNHSSSIITSTKAPPATIRR
jgi:hypothetical protein